MTPITNPMTAAYGDPIKQYSGQVQVQRRVRVKAPGKFFNNLTAAEVKLDYWSVAVEYRERHAFDRHARAWGAAHNGPGIRFIAEGDAIEDPDSKGFWATLGVWNKWRHQTYLEDREAEKQYLDAMPALPAAPPAAAEKKAAEPAAIKKCFKECGGGTHTIGGTGRMAGKQYPFKLWGCVREGCSRGVSKPIKQIGSGTGDLFSHLDTCQPVLAKQLRAASNHSPVRIGEDGEEYSIFSFRELLPHHARFVIKCFKGYDHFYETRADNGLLEWVQGFEKRAALPHEQTCKQLLQASPPPPRAPTPSHPHTTTLGLWLSKVRDATRSRTIA